jgi:hypothetical protein
MSLINAYSVHGQPRNSTMTDFSINTASPFGSACLTALLAAGLCSPITARTQTAAPVAAAADFCLRPPAGHATTEDRRFATAYGRFVRLADRGDAAAASAAIFMLHHGRALFGSDWSASERQQAHWHALAVNAARHRLPVVSNGADD